MGARAGKHKLGARARAGGQAKGRVPGNTNTTERQKTSFLKETVENADVHKAVLQKTMTTQEYCVQYDFVAPLIIKFSQNYI